MCFSHITDESKISVASCILIEAEVTEICPSCTDIVTINDDPQPAYDLVAEMIRNNSDRLNCFDTQGNQDLNIEVTDVVKEVYEDTSYICHCKKAM